MPWNVARAVNNLSPLCPAPVTYQSTLHDLCSHGSLTGLIPAPSDPTTLFENGAERPSQWNLLGRNGMFGDKP